MSDNKERATSPAEVLRKKIGTDKIGYERVYDLENLGQLALAVVTGKDNDPCQILLVTDIPGPLIFHWGVANRSRVGWTLPPSCLRPEGTSVFQNTAAQTKFDYHDEQFGVLHFGVLHFTIEEKNTPMGILFVLNQPDTGRWLDNHKRNFYIPLKVPPEYEKALPDPELAALIDEIIDKEMNSGSWTLMHRFNLCHDLLDGVKKNDLDALSSLFVWLRFSAIRQLDWQRNYNTQPRQLGQAEDRLTRKLADRYIWREKESEFIRLIMATLGRGADGQRVRDEILHIMHRHNFKEVSGHLLEEWHQKLHNNTTPDDVVICQAYIEFLKSNGNHDLFYGKLAEGGVTRERLQSYDRSIRSDPEFIPHLKDELIHDFENFLGILKSVHSGADLGIAIEGARYLFDDYMHGLMNFIWSNQGDLGMAVGVKVEKITAGRRWVKDRLMGQPQNARDLLFLDLALEDYLRVVVEGSLQAHMEVDQMVELIGRELENLGFSREDEELDNCLRHWNRLGQMPRFGKEWSNRADAVLDRLTRALGDHIDEYYRLIQPKAEFLGNAFQADPWSITLFSEEVVRGRPAFILAKLLRQLRPVLRKSAELGDWQVISRGSGAGYVELVEDLKSIEGKEFSRPTIIITDKVAGNENFPTGVTAVITPDATDLVSHVAIRARNAYLLLATCYNPDVIEHLKAQKGECLSLRVSANGEVMIEEGPGQKREEAGPKGLPKLGKPHFKPDFTAYAVSAPEFTEKNTGGKSNNLKRLQDKLPDWIRLPTSVALPFGVFEKVLSEEENKEVASRYRELSRRVDEMKGDARNPILDELRSVVLDLRAPHELVSSLRTVMEKAKFDWPALWWDDAWMCIKQVWSSKWNDRAYLSRKTMKIPHQDLSMAVLIQEIVKAEYSFVIHTVNPFTGNQDELYAEVVPGLGETLVGNYPGRALGFTCQKGKEAHLVEEPRLMTFPSKSLGLFGSGLIFRSDSSGEDLAAFAGAGLYSSVMLPAPRSVTLDYTNDRLLWDENFRKGFLLAIMHIGRLIEEAFGFPQDIEGAYSEEKYYVVQTRPQVGIK